MQSKNYEETLLYVLTKMFGVNIISADYEGEQLQDGMSGVRLIEGMAETDGGEKMPYRLILKVQYDRRPPFVPDSWDSWTREYKIYASDFYKILNEHEIFDEKLRMLKCYHSEISDDGDVYSLWLEYADGINDEALTLDNLEYIAEQFGRFQGRIYKHPKLLENMNCLHECSYIEEYYGYKSSVDYDYLCSDECDLPSHLKQMLLYAYNSRETIFQKFKQFPIVLSHGDFYISNVVLKNDEVILMDWGDGAGWGYIGEDIANLIVDEIDIKYFNEYYRRIVPAYLKGLSEYMDISAINDLYFRDMFIIRFGYDFLSKYRHTKSLDAKNEQITALQQIYDIGK